MASAAERLASNVNFSAFGALEIGVGKVGR